jgi:glycosyltransferase involved in cell wall biosynthesis
MINGQKIISIIIPCFNEGEVILENINKAINMGKRIPIEFIFINNGSSDNTANIFNDVRETLPEFIRLVTIKNNQGYGYAIKKVISMCKGDFIGWTHGDGQTNLFDIRIAYSAISKSGASGIIKGVRVRRPFLDQFTSYSLDLLISILFLKRITETNAQPSIYKRCYLNNYSFYSNKLFFDIDAYIFARLHGAQEMRFNVKFPPRLFGESSWQRGFYSKLNFIGLTLAHLIKLKINIKKYLKFKGYKI